jgi:integrase
MRGKGEGSIFKDGRGLWTAKLELPARNGNRRRKVIRSKSKSVVLAKLREWEKEKDKSGGDLPTKSITTEQWINEWFRRVALKRIRPTTANTYRSLIDNHIIPLVGKKQMDKLTPANVSDMADAILAKGLSQRTALQSYRILATALAVAQSEGHVSRNVAALVEPPRLPSGEARALTMDEAIKILHVAATDPLGSMWAALLFTGARQGELLGLERSRVTSMIELSWQLQRLPWRHGCSVECGRLPKNCPQRTHNAPADWESRELYGSLILSRPKSKAGIRIVPLVEPLRSIIERYIAETGPNEFDLVWTHQGKPMDPRKHLRLWHELLEKAGVAQAGVHATRHTAVDLLYAAGVSEDLIIEIVGHSTRSMSRAYKSRANIPRLTEAMRQMSAQLMTPGDERSDTPAAIDR